MRRSAPIGLDPLDDWKPLLPYMAAIGVAYVLWSQAQSPSSPPKRRSRRATRGKSR